MWVSKKKWKSIEKRLADLEGQVQSQQSQFENILITYVRPPVNAVGSNCSFWRNYGMSNAGGGGGHSIQYFCPTREALLNIDKNFCVLRSLLEDVNISPKVKLNGEESKPLEEFSPEMQKKIRQASYAEIVKALGYKRKETA